MQDTFLGQNHTNSKVMTYSDEPLETLPSKSARSQMMGGTSFAHNRPGSQVSNMCPVMPEEVDRMSAKKSIDDK